jgi:hypothetical protein
VACARDQIHFSSEGYRELGRRYAETMLPLLNGEVGQSGEGAARR